MFSRLRVAIITLVIGTFGLAVFSLSSRYSLFYIYQARDITRAEELIRGQWIWHGPEVSGGGFLPGNLYYILLALMLKVYDSWISCWYGMLIMATLGGVGVWVYLSKRFGSNVGLLWLLTYFGSPFNLIVLSCFWNPSYTLAFVLGSICLMIEVFVFGGGLYSLVLLFALLAFNIQLHLSGLFLLISVLVLWFKGSAWGLLVPGKRSFILAALTGLVWFLPYLYYLLSSGNTRFEVEDGQAWSWALFHYGEIAKTWTSFVSRNGLLQATKGLALSLLILLPWSFIFRPISFIKSPQIVSGDDPGTILLRRRLKVLFLVILGVSSLTAVPLVFSLGYFSKYRYGLPFFVVLQLGSSLLGVKAWGKVSISLSSVRKNSRFWIYIFTGIVWVTVASYFLSGLVRESRRYAPSILEMKEALEFVQSQTCWTKSEMKEKIFSVNIYSFVSWDHLLEEKCQVRRNSIQNQENTQIREVKQGISNVIFFVAKNSEITHSNSKMDELEFLQNSGFEAVFLEQIENNELELQRVKHVGPIQIIYVKELRAYAAPLRFQNRGYPYGSSALDDKWQKLSLRSGSISKLSENSLLIMKDNCRVEAFDQINFCLVGIEIGLFREMDPTLRLRISISSPSLSQPSFWIKPNSTIAWRGIFVEFQCIEQKKKHLAKDDAKKYRRYLVSSLGYYDQFGRQTLNSSALSPFTRDIVTPCTHAQSLANLILGVENRVVNTLWEQIVMSGFDIEVPLEQISAIN